MTGIGSPVSGRYRQWREARRERARARALVRVTERLEDAEHDSNAWGFADTPADRRRRKAEWTRMIREYLSLGGTDPMQFRPWRYNEFTYRAAAEAAGWKGPTDDD